jgi:hypothetical protein
VDLKRDSGLYDTAFAEGLQAHLSAAMTTYRIRFSGYINRTCMNLTVRISLGAFPEPTLARAASGSEGKSSSESDTATAFGSTFHGGDRAPLSAHQLSKAKINLIFKNSIGFMAGVSKVRGFREEIFCKTQRLMGRAVCARCSYGDLLSSLQREETRNDISKTSSGSHPEWELTTPTHHSLFRIMNLCEGRCSGHTVKAPNTPCSAADTPLRKDPLHRLCADCERLL